MDLLSLVLTLHPLGLPAHEQPAPRWWGRAAHALLLDVIRQYDPALAEAFHDAPSAADDDAQSPIENRKSDNLIRPFTVSTLMGPSTREGLNPQETYRLRLTAFDSRAAELLGRAAAEGRLSPGSAIELDYRPFTVEAVVPGPQSPLENLQSEIENQKSPNPWAAVTTYQELSSPFLLGKLAAPRRIAFAFTSPTTFKSGGRHQPLPLPGLVFGSLLEKWNAFAPLAFPPEAKRYAEECLAVSRFDLESRPVAWKGGAMRVGAVGEVTFATLNYDRYWMSVLATLAAFSLFAGVGAGTTQGLGQARGIFD